MSLLKKIGFYAGCLALGCVMLVAGLDKGKLFYSLGSTLKEQGVVVEPVRIDSRWFGVELKGVKVYYNNSLVLGCEAVDVSFAGFKMAHVGFENMLKNVIGFGVEEVSYGIFSPLSVSFFGEMGEGKAVYDMTNNAFVVKIKPSQMMRESKNAAYFKEVEQELVYEYRL